MVRGPIETQVLVANWREEYNTYRPHSALGTRHAYALRVRRSGGEQKLIRIYADSNNRDEEGRFNLNVAGSIRDIEALGPAVKTGEQVVLHMTDEFEVTGTLEFDVIWKAVPDWNSIKYLNE